ncbi:U-box domain-containing protein 25-like [Typha latifolia]|uniref:U-box domain-containing protein 25-like n=1 Tax=Typha latifolia TaxID=4733 RepID=UPI003C2E1A66
MSIPHLFRCPISLDLFTDPVTLCTGQTYDRPCIEKWLADGNRTCPVTMQTLDDMSLVPNCTLRHLIDQWLLDEPDPNCPPKPFSLATLKYNLQSESSTIAMRLDALRKVRILSAESDIGQACLIQLGFFQLLLHLIFQSQVVSHHHHLELVELALECVLSLLPSTQLDSLSMLQNDSYLASFLQLFEQGTVKTKTSLCQLIETIATSPATMELATSIGNSRRVLRVLVSILHCKHADDRASEAAVRAVYAVCVEESSRESAVREGVMKGLIAYLSVSVQKSVSRALATVEVLLGLESGKRSLAKNSGAVRVLVRHVFVVSSDHDGGEHAVGALLIMCCDSARLRAEAVDAGLLTQLLLLLQSQCNSRTKTKARALLRLLRSMWG